MNEFHISQERQRHIPIRCVLSKHFHSITTYVAFWPLMDLTTWPGLTDCISIFLPSAMVTRICPGKHDLKKWQKTVQRKADQKVTPPPQHYVSSTTGGTRNDMYSVNTCYHSAARIAALWVDKWACTRMIECTGVLPAAPPNYGFGCTVGPCFVNQPSQIFIGPFATNSRLPKELHNNCFCKIIAKIITNMIDTISYHVIISYHIYITHRTQSTIWYWYDLISYI